MSFIKDFKSFLNESEKTDIENDIMDIAANIPGKIVFDDCPELKVGGRVWYICGISPDKTYEKLNIFYKDSKTEKEKKVDFFDFHPDTFEDLLELIQGKMLEHDL